MVSKAEVRAGLLADEQTGLTYDKVCDMADKALNEAYDWSAERQRAASAFAAAEVEAMQDDIFKRMFDGTVDFTCGWCNNKIDARTGKCPNCADRGARVHIDPPREIPIKPAPLTMIDVCGKHGRIVAMVEFSGHLYVATETGVFVKRDDDTFVQCEIVMADEINPGEGGATVGKSALLSHPEPCHDLGAYMDQVAGMRPLPEPIEPPPEPPFVPSKFGEHGGR